jgi:diguanylate cyclase (GGDEF)-like protein
VKQEQTEAVVPKGNPGQTRKSIIPLHKLGQRLTLYFVSIGAVLTVLMVSGLLYKQYLHDRNTIFAESEKTIQTIRQQLARSLWNVDHDSTRILLEGVYRQPYVKGVRVVESLGQVYEYGVLNDAVDHEVDLSVNDQVVGRLELSIDESLIRRGVFGQFVTTFINTMLVIGIIALVFSIIVKRSITQHLSHISRVTSEGDSLNSKTYVPIRLNRRPFNDEINDLVEALNRGRKQVVEFTIERESYESQLQYQANYDVLTNLPNRRHIDRHLRSEMLRHQKSEEKYKLALFFIDLDGFKEVNDSLGHSIGDKILQDSAARLSYLIDRYDGYVARFGGDEFIACFHCQTRTEAEVVAEETILTFKENFSLRDTQLQLGCSIGIVLFPDDGSSPEELIRKADTAMYKAKENGRNTFAFFDQSMMHDIVLNNTIKNKLQDAVAKQQLELHFQPLINLKDMSITGFEALLRWEDEDLGRVGPDIFIPIAEKTGLIFNIDIWVFEQAINQVERWREQFDLPFIVAINFSATNFHQRQIYSWINKHEIFLKPLDWVELEVTERLVLDDDPVVLRGIEQLLQTGLRFSIDDFGTGYSSLGYIKKFSHILSKIKIDRMFVNELIKSDSDRALVKSIITLADSLSIQVLAEGIESRKQEEVLIKLGCDYAQGYFYSKPLPVSQIPEFIERWNRIPHLVRSV